MRKEFVVLISLFVLLVAMVVINFVVIGLGS